MEFPKGSERAKPGENYQTGPDFDIVEGADSAVEQIIQDPRVPYNVREELARRTAAGNKPIKVVPEGENMFPYHPGDLDARLAEEAKQKGPKGSE